MRIAIFSDEIGWHTRQLQAALRARGAQGRCVDLADCDIDLARGVQGLSIPGFRERLPDAAIVRGIAGGSFEQVTKRLGVLHALRELGIPVYNDARAIERSVDKSMSSLLLHAAGVATPPAWAIESPQAAQRLVMRESAARRALVLKPLFGSQGHGLQRVGWVDGAHLPLPALDTPGYGRMAYLQRFIAAQAHDWRVLVIGGRARAAMQRVGSGAGQWIHNIAQGARPVRAVLTPELAALAEAAARALGMDYAGVDLLPSSAGPQVLEVNGVAAWHGLQRVTAFNIAQAIVDDLLDRRMARSAQPARSA
ncbi:ATP-grasp domain-containing protein [Rivibacter subsaxonicus]|uniref:RimK family alpha-L-glutamate ligase n=1 Tax=Rivibacter subsaxonicus TaxID=457575 RepID=A0A4Q7W1L2_9BURK|nr:RimK family alpha-L-glutamate ligase [Rivibacter subsaxonicus]RZU02725.1 RimK family alpha-L-glutamate ligase [Rivibacter subsaxonicus]